MDLQATYQDLADRAARLAATAKQANHDLGTDGANEILTAAATLGYHLNGARQDAQKIAHALAARQPSKPPAAEPAPPPEAA